MLRSHGQSWTELLPTLSSAGYGVHWASMVMEYWRSGQGAMPPSGSRVRLSDLAGMVSFGGQS